MPFRKITDEERELLKNVDMPADLDACVKLVMTLEADYHANDEWDQPAILYMVVGDLKDPYFIRHSEVFGHPAQHLQALWDHGMRFRENVHGLAFACETWAHLTFEEMEKVEPELIKQMMVGAEAVFGTEEAREEMVKAYHNVVNERFPMPSEMPDRLRTEARDVTLTFRNGTTLGVHRQRNHDPYLMDPTPWELAQAARVPKFIHQMLNNQRPESSPGENLWNTEEQS